MTTLNELLTIGMDDPYEEAMKLMAESMHLLGESIQLLNAGRIEEAERCRAEADQLKAQADACFAGWKKITAKVLAEALARADGNMNVRLSDIADPGIEDGIRIAGVPLPDQLLTFRERG